MKIKWGLMFVIWISLANIIVFGIFWGVNANLSSNNLIEEIEKIEQIGDLNHAKQVAISATELAQAERILRFALTRVIYVMTFFALSMISAGWFYVRRLRNNPIL